MPEWIAKIWQAIIDYPKSWSDYVGVGRWMIYKKLFIILCVILLVLALILAGVIIRQRTQKPQGVPVFASTDEALMLHSGEVIIVDSQGAVLYRGLVADGLRSGWGQDYAPQRGVLLYEGEYKQGFYSGQGRLYDNIYGSLIYEGGFVDGKYDGMGALYESSRKRYEGAFRAGMRDGEGVEYDADGNVIYVGGFARGLREGQGLETDSMGNPVYEGGFRGGVYDGEGALYTSSGARLRFEGSFFNGKQGREGKIYNNRGQLLYDGAIFKGDVDCMSFLGADIADLTAVVKETPVVYYGCGYTGFLYPELGIAAIGSYPQESAEAPAQGVLINTMLVDGRRYGGQLPLDAGAQVKWDTLTGFEALISQRLAAVFAPRVPLQLGGRIEREGDMLYRVEGLPDSVSVTLHGVYYDLVYYMNSDAPGGKGGSSDVIHCRKADFGG